VEELEEGVGIVAGEDGAAGGESGDDLGGPPLADEAFELAPGCIGHVIEQSDGGEGAGAGVGDGGSGRSGEGLFQAGGEGGALGAGEEVLAPVEDEGLLAEIGRLTEGEGDGLAAGVSVAGDLIVESQGESRLRHRCIPGDESGELLPTGGIALALAAEEAEALGAEEEAGVFGGDGDRLCGKILRRGGYTAGEDQQRGKCPHAHDCVTGSPRNFASSVLAH